MRNNENRCCAPWRIGQNSLMQRSLLCFVCLDCSEQYIWRRRYTRGIIRLSEMPQWDIRSCKANVCQFQCQYQLEGHSVERMYLRQSCSQGSRWIKPLNHASLQRLAPNTCTLDFPDAIKSRVAAHTTSEKAIRFRHTDYNPDRAQKLISSSMSRHLSTRNISYKFMHAFFE